MSILRMIVLAVVAALGSQGSAFAQAILFSPVLETDGVEVMAARYQASGASRAMPAATGDAVAAHWSLARAEELLRTVETIGSEGLNPADYAPGGLRQAIGGGAGPQLDSVASQVFAWLVEDLRDGRTPVSARGAWHVEDPDGELMPTATLMARALGGGVSSVLRSLAPSNEAYGVLRAALASASPEERKLIAANMDRWRWLPRDLGGQYLLVNTPEYRLRLMVNGEEMRSYRVIVGGPGRTATPQLSEVVEGVIFNPTWTVPQSIVVGEGLGRRVLNNPAWARSMGYTATRSADGSLHVVQQPGPSNALGRMKLDMPNPYSIFLHDTPARQRFEEDYRALSHGCIRVQDALELALTLTGLGEGASATEAMRIADSGDYTKVPLRRPIPVYIAYFTMGPDENGQLAKWDDIYNRDVAVRAALEAPGGRQLAGK